MIKRAKHHHIEDTYLYGIAVLSVIILSLVAKPISSARLHLTERSALGKQEEVLRQLFNKEVFKNVVIKGRAYVVYDIVDGTVIAEKNGDMILPLASLTKIMTTFTARAHHPKGTKIIIKPESIDGGYDLGLRKNQEWTLDELLKYTLVFSSNDGALAVADDLGGRSIFVSQMNKDAEILGLSMNFTHPAGLDVNGKIGGTGSARMTAKLLGIARRNYPEIFDATTKPRSTVSASTGKITGIPNTNQSILDLEGVEASKTGYTDMAGGNLAVVVDITLGHPVAIVVLGSTKEDRFKDVFKLYEALKISVQ
jgi:D-alanyl-D-alanine carboxypeptidase